jgi:monoterpene epsilon-lactone hydrolase
MLRQMPTMWDLSVEEQRALGEGFGDLTSEPEGVTYEPVDAGGVPAEWVTPDDADPEAVLLYLHGGGYVIGSVASHRKLVGHLCKAAGCRGISVDYRLAPEHPHPAAVEDSTTAYRWLLAQGVEPGRIAIAGDSAGGGLTLTTLLSLRDAGTPLPAAAVPLSPWTDMEGTGESMTSRAVHDPLVADAGLKAMADLFLSGKDARDPLASPLHADPTGLPPLLIQVGDHEVLLDDSVRFAARAEKAGVDVTLEIWPEMIHVFQMGAGNVPESTQAVARIGEWLAPRMRG